MRVFVSIILIIIILFNLDCASISEIMKKEAILYRCKATYKTGNLTIRAGKKGKIFLLENSICFTSNSGKEIYEKIPYNKIRSFRYEETSEILLQKKGRTQFPLTMKRGSMFSSSWESLLNMLPFISILIAGILIINMLRDYIYMIFEIENSNDSKWGVFKIEEESFFKMKKILEERCGLESLK